MKKLINAVNHVVPEMLEGLVQLSPGLALMKSEMVVLDAASAKLRAAGQVAIISGGGAGHEPAHAGYVGAGMLSAAVSGDVFSSPSVDAVLAGIRAVAGSGGVLLLVKSYTGDHLNFGLAAEIARSEGIAAQMVVIGDDVSLPANAGAGRRGIAGTVFVHKIAGAAAASGASLDDVAAEARAAAEAVGSMGVGLSSCTVPAAGRPGFELGDDEIELGLGIHGEPGVRRSRLLAADELTDLLLARIISEKGIQPGARVALLVNNLGATPTMEMLVVARRALAYLGEQGIVVERAWCGTFLTALEMAGVSLSLLTLDDTRLARLDAKTNASAWPHASGHVAALAAVAPEHAAQPVASATKSGAAPSADLAPVRLMVLAVCTALQAAKDHLTDLDQVVGDGDIGISLARGSDAIIAEMDGYGAASPADVLRGISGTLRRVIGGTSGPLYAIFLLRGAAVLAQHKTLDRAGLSAAFTAGCTGIAELGGATKGDRTMLDALLPAAEALASDTKAGSAAEIISCVVQAAAAGRDATATMLARRGRTSYLGERALGHVDPGAAAVVIWLTAIADAMGGKPGN